MSDVSFHWYRTIGQTLMSRSVHSNLIHNPSCSCGYSTENAEHFLLYCKRFDTQRNILYHSLLAANVHIDLNTLLFGSQIYNIDTNRHVFITVQTYIKEACRFFLSADYRECNQVTIGLWLTWCELVNVAIHTCEHFMLKFLLNK